jgi:hypothetical protein
MKLCEQTTHQHLRSEVLHHRGEVHRSTRANTVGVLALLQETSNTTDRELKSRLR